MSHLLQVKELKKYFEPKSCKKGSIKAVDGVSFYVDKGETLGLVGESGSGKSTLGRTVLQLLQANCGQVLFEGKDLCKASQRELRKMRSEIQIVFQDPYASLNPSMTVQRILEEPLLIHTNLNKNDRLERIHKIIELVELPCEHLSRYPHQFSGGQRQRIGIARALITNPKFIVCDEPVSALDVSVQSQVLNLLCDLQEKLGLTYLFIAHGLNVVKHVSDRVAVMYLGKIVEIGDVDVLYSTPKHPYTAALLSSIPDPSGARVGERIILQGEIPSPANPPAGCRFCTRCSYVMARCKCEEPALRDSGGGQYVACHLFDR